MPRTFSHSLLLFVSVVCVCFMIGMARGATLGETSDFQDGTDQGWTNELANHLIEVRTGGMDGDDDRFLFIRSTGTSGPGSRMAVLNSLGAWTGDYNGATAVELDMMNPVDSKELEMRFVLFGPNSDFNRWTSDVALVVPNDGVWRHYSFPISSEDFVRVQGSAAYGDMLSGVVKAMFRHDIRTPSSRGDTIAAMLGIDNVRLMGLASVLGDFDGNGVVDVLDVNLLLAEVKAGSNQAGFDLDADGLVDELDIGVMLNSPDILNSYIGDANLDGVFGTADFVMVLQAGLYEDDILMNASWETGDWNGDAEFNTSDLVFALQGGGYEVGPRPPAVNAVPEPSNILLLALGVIAIRLVSRIR